MLFAVDSLCDESRGDKDHLQQALEELKQRQGAHLDSDSEPRFDVVLAADVSCTSLPHRHV